MSGPKQDTPTPVNGGEYGQPGSRSKETSNVGAAVRKREVKKAVGAPSHTWSIAAQASAGSSESGGTMPRDMDKEIEDAGYGDDMSQDEVLAGIGAWTWKQ